MTNYHPIVARAIGALDSNNEESRRRVYDRARAALLSEVHKLVPALDQSEIMAEQLYLEVAIGEVEADMQRDQGDRSAVGTPFTAFPCGGVEGRGSRMREYGQDFRRSGKGAAARYQGPYGQPAEA
jgi:hypothetical protein